MRTLGGQGRRGGGLLGGLPYGGVRALRGARPFLGRAQQGLPMRQQGRLLGLHLACHTGLRGNCGKFSVSLSR